MCFHNFNNVQASPSGFNGAYVGCKRNTLQFLIVMTNLYKKLLHIAVGPQLLNAFLAQCKRQLLFQTYGTRNIKCYNVDLADFNVIKSLLKQTLFIVESNINSNSNAEL